MKKITVTIELEDDELAWLETWAVFSPEPPHPPLTVAQKIAACVFAKWSEVDYQPEN